MLTFTPSLFFQHATCPHWIWRDLYGDPKRKGEVPELSKKLLEQGVLHEDDYIKGLTITTVDRTLGEAGYDQTLQLMQQGVPLIYQGQIRMKKAGVHYTGRPDLLERVPISSKFGSYSYRPVDIKNSKDIKTTHWLQLTLYAMILEDIQGIFPDDVVIINSEHERIRLYLTELHKQKTSKKITEILEIMQGYKPPLKLVSGCKNSPWFSECVREAEQADDIALIYKLDSRALEQLRVAGITTVHQAAEMNLFTLPPIPFTTFEGLQRVKLQAQSLVDKTIHWLGHPTIPETPVKIYFDIEGDPLLQVQYLFGFWIVGDPQHRFGKAGHVIPGDKPDRYYLYFLAETPDDEEVMWKQFVHWLKTLPHHSYSIYHFADYERSRTLGMAKRYGGLELVEPFVNKFIDLCAIVQASVIFPLYFYSIKDIAKSKFVNYKWRHPKAGGAQSIFWYEKWLETGDKQVLQDIINYNEDDVVATEYLHTWLKQSGNQPSAKQG